MNKMKEKPEQRKKAYQGLREIRDKLSNIESNLKIVEEKGKKRLGAKV
jgi:hypothetical protein